MKKIFTPFLSVAFSFLFIQPVFSQQPGLVISSIFPNPSGADENFEFVELTATKAIDFTLTKYTVIFVTDGGSASAVNGWITGGSSTYAIEINTGTIAVGEKIYVGGNALIITGAACKKVQKNTAIDPGDGGIGSAGNGGILGNGGASADGVGVFDLTAATITNISVPVDAIFFGTGVGTATGKFTVPTNDHYNNAQGKFGVGTNTYLAPDPGGNDHIRGTGEFNPGTFTWTTGRTFAITTSVPNCNAASSVTVAIPNTLTFSVNTALTTPYLAPPDVSGVISDATDPAATLGIVFTVKDAGIDIPSANYTITGVSSNAAVVTNGNITATKSNGLANVKILPSGVGYCTITLTLDKAGVTKTYVVNYAASAMGANTTANTHYHSGFADASTAIALDDDYMIVSDDENNKLLVYNRKNSGLPVKSFDYSTLLNLTDLNGGVPREIDLEGSAKGIVDPTRVYWIASMSNKSSDPPYDPRPNRNRIFATTHTGTGAATAFTYVGDYENLRNSVIAWGDANGFNLSASAAPGMDPKLIDGFNVEGLCFAPNNTTLYIGFRAPLLPTASRTKALIAPILNFETWFGNGSPGAAPTFGSPILLDLNGWGIRSIDKLSNNYYVIIAGNYDDGPFNGAVFTWNGNPADAPLQQNGFNITGMNPEGFLQVNSGGNIVLNQLHLISDNGAFIYYNDAIAAKDLGTPNFKKFRTDISTNALNVLPVIFTYFDLQVRNKNNAFLLWSCADITEAATFEVQRSQGGTAYSTIATLIAIPGRVNYYYEDMGLPKGTYEYRIKVTNRSGPVFYTAVKLATITDRDVFVSIYPNPVVNNTVKIVTNDNGEKYIRIINSAGAIVYETRFTGISTTLSLPGLPKGLYILQVQGNEYVQYIQMIK